MKNKMKRAAAGTAALVLVSAAAASSQVMAAESADGSNEVVVTYENKAPDPDKPTAPKWGVSIPAGIEFTDTAKTADVTVELKPLEGAAMSDFSDSFSANVKVKSLNGMQMVNGSSKVDYTLNYGATKVTGTDYVSVADLTKAAPVKAGTAEMTGNATATGEHADRLTYVISSNLEK